jgi:hypothetical protein
MAGNGMRYPMANEILHVIRAQLMYISRPHCRVRNRFIEKISENLKEAEINPDGDLWIEIMARVIRSCNPMSRSQREEIIYPCLDAINFLIRSLKDDFE